MKHWDFSFIFLTALWAVSCDNQQIVEISWIDQAFKGPGLLL